MRIPEACPGGRASVGLRMAFGRGRLSFMLAAALAGAPLPLGSAQAQDRAGIEARIETVFDLVPQNAIDLAVPLTRRALAQRAMDMGGLKPLGRVRSVVRLDAAAKPEKPGAPSAHLQAYAPASDAEQNRTAALVPPSRTPEISSAEAAAWVEPIEEGSAEGDGDDDNARLPRPRPETHALIGSPLDLVAGSAVADEEAAASDVDLTDLDVTAAAMTSLPPETTAALPPDAFVGLPPVSSAEPSMAAATAAVPTSVAPDAGQIVAASNTPPHDRVAGAKCLSVEAVSDKDGDFRRNAAVFEGADLCIAQQKFKERRRPWTIQTISSGRPGPLWAVMHDDEAVAFDSALHALKTYGGTMVAIETGGKRNQDGIDPNRNFSGEGVGCAKIGDAASQKFTAAFQKLLDPAQPIVVLHNNYDGHVPTGGLGHVSMSAVPKGMKKAKSKIPDSPLADDHTLVLLAALEPIDPAVEDRMEDLSAAGVNVVLEPVQTGKGDCSLSNYSVLTGHKDYFNVTVDHDGGDKQRRIIDLIMGARAKLAAVE